ncbi:Methyltransferase domain-containing protein [Flavobacterium swingsii]|jgi:trans-aconitate methyltransferase|uniref:Methyltransferase domain-containing protein n=1 Tax=Flavobacterium swingsii TaxID=498292 RepID=A0A1I0ZUS9_9FLAO|nr:class I SAM-dependent methyltransferase [Flavobacterium swingsii]SFB29484.1 Methyltransferase domain-containing protein [Flavobacterium swingsii]
MDQTKIAVDIFNKLATVYQDKFMDVSLYYDSLDVFCQSIPKQNAEILELACGPGNITKYLLEKRPDFKILGTDLAPKMIELAQINNPTAKFQLLDCRDVNKINAKFDAIVCGFGLPYLSKEDAIQFITDAGNQLNSNGVLYISTMEDDNSKSGFKTGSTGDKMYQNFHQADYLTKALEDNGFKIINLQRKNYFYNEQDTTDLIIIATK